MGYADSGAKRVEERSPLTKHAGGGFVTVGSGFGREPPPEIGGYPERGHALWQSLRSISECFKCVKGSANQKGTRSDFGSYPSTIYLGFTSSKSPFVPTFAIRLTGDKKAMEVGPQQYSSTSVPLFEQQPACNRRTITASTTNHDAMDPYTIVSTCRSTDWSSDREVRQHPSQKAVRTVRRHALGAGNASRRA